MPEDPVPVKGIVKDKTGSPLAGVTIQVKGKSVGVVTDPDGKFALAAEPEDSLVISYIGYETQVLRVGKTSDLAITLDALSGSLNEVVVVAYGQQKKVTVTGAVSSVNTDQLRQSSSASLANALAGRLSGLTSIQSAGGQPGRDDATMYLRGAATTNGTAPLILIDGVPRDNIRTLDPNEVASVSVLKDASATAVFGVRGANGVILITTKRGSAGKTQLNINVEQSFSSFTREPERLHSLEYMKLRNEAAANDGIAEPPFSQEVMDRYANPLAGLDPSDPDYAQQAALRKYMYPDHDYYREYIARYSPQTRVNLGASGGTAKVAYFVNAVYLHQGGNLKTEPESNLGYDPSSWMDRYNFRANLDYNISSSFKAFLNIGSYIEKVNMPAAWLYGDDTNWMMRDLLYQAQTILPITPGPTTLPGYGIEAGQIVDPGYLDRSAFEIMNRMGYRNEVRSNLNTSLGMEWDLGNTVTKGLSLKGMISYDSKATTATQGRKSERLYLANVDPATNTLNYAVKRADEDLLALVKGADSRYNINLQASLNYNRSFGKHDVGGMLLAQRDNWESTGGELPFNVVGLASRFTYAYDNRYLAEVDMGYNGSEQFAPSRRFGFFPAVSAGWVISNEAFLKGNRTLTNLKLRASYGKVGNDILGATRETSPRFLYQSDITLGVPAPFSSLGLGQYVNMGLLGNPDITWELSEKQNYGIDIGLFSDLSLSFDYYLEHRTDILITRGTVPEFQGVPLGNIPKVNMGRVKNQGYEIELTYNKTISKDLAITVRGNYGYNHNIVEFVDEPQRDETYAYRYRTTGFPIGQAWGYKIDYSNGNGYFNTQQELDDYLSHTTYSFGAPRLGDFKYVDLNKDGVIDDKDQAPIKYSSIPGIIYGLSFSVQYKGFSLTPFFQGVGRYSTNYADQGVYENIKNGTYFSYQKNAWTQERYENHEKITYPALSTHTTTNHRANDFFIMDRSFIRLKDIELAYTLPAGVLKKYGVQQIRFYISGQNLFTWDKLRMNHLDPENSDPIGYPVTKMTNFGVNITL
ncbi:TonB-dependent receptor [Compostibacter hankyongensis]|uniref:TonB-dependent receptor n=2 Tax=Compostibacter hankyongensis TaxID=1007089 RepID=A0ABP8G2X0_9BACT